MSYGAPDGWSEPVRVSGCIWCGATGAESVVFHPSKDLEFCQACVDLISIKASVPRAAQEKPTSPKKTKGPACVKCYQGLCWPPNECTDSNKNLSWEGGLPSARRT